MLQRRLGLGTNGCVETAAGGSGSRLISRIPDGDPSLDSLCRWHPGCSLKSRSPDHSRRWPLPEQIRASEEMLRRVQGEYLEMPGLRLTEPQARRLWGLDAASCDALLHALVDSKFLFRTRDGAFMRVDHAGPVKATLRRRSTIAVA
jgi:hypothetical protein